MSMSSDKTYQSCLPLAELSPSSADQLRILPWKAFKPVSAPRLSPMPLYSRLSPSEPALELPSARCHVILSVRGAKTGAEKKK